MTTKLLKITIALAIGLTISQASSAATMTFSASRDNTIFNESNNSNGKSGDFATGVVNNGRIRRGLLHFDLSAIPADAQIDDVTLQLHLFQVSGNDTIARDFLVHRLNSDWGEGNSTAGGTGGGGGSGGGTGAPAQTGDSTWIRAFYDTISWTTAGGDFEPVASAATSVGITPAYFEWSSPGLIADVQVWIDGAESNFGWLVRSDESAQGGRRFDSLQSATADFRPLLSVQFTPVPEPATTTLALTALVCFGCRSRFRTRIGGDLWQQV